MLGVTLLFLFFFQYTTVKPKLIVPWFTIIFPTFGTSCLILVPILIGSLFQYYGKQSTCTVYTVQHFETTCSRISPCTGKYCDWLYIAPKFSDKHWTQCQSVQKPKKTKHELKGTKMYTKKQDYSYFLYWTNSGTQLLLPFMSHKKLTVLHCV